MARYNPRYRWVEKTKNRQTTVGAVLAGIPYDLFENMVMSAFSYMICTKRFNEADSYWGDTTEIIRRLMVAIGKVPDRPIPARLKNLVVDVKEGRKGEWTVICSDYQFIRNFITCASLGVTERFPLSRYTNHDDNWQDIIPALESRTYDLTHQLERYQDRERLDKYNYRLRPISSLSKWEFDQRKEKMKSDLEFEKMFRKITKGDRSTKLSVMNWKFEQTHKAMVGA